MYKNVFETTCPSCGGRIAINKNLQQAVCPSCKSPFDVSPPLGFLDETSTEERTTCVRQPPNWRIYAVVLSSLLMAMLVFPLMLPRHRPDPAPVQLASLDVRHAFDTYDSFAQRYAKNLEKGVGFAELPGQFKFTIISINPPARHGETAQGSMLVSIKNASIDQVMRVEFIFLRDLQEWRYYKYTIL